MGVYSIGKLISEARKLASDYRRATGKPLAGVAVEIAEYDASTLLDLDLNVPPGSSYDAVGRGAREGKRVIIKGRTIFDEEKKGQRIGQIKAEQEWDSVVMVLMNEDHEPFEIYEADRDELADELEDAKQSKRAKRGAMSVAKFKNISRLVWTKEEGVIDDEIWDNQASN